jgi:hypothetical protein
MNRDVNEPQVSFCLKEQSHSLTLMRLFHRASRYRSSELGRPFNRNVRDLCFERAT